MQLQSKLANAPIYFPTEWHKIEFTRDHCKGVAWKTVKARATPDSKHPYVYLVELLNDLDLIFGEDEATELEQGL